MESLIKNNSLHCPLCAGNFQISDYLGKLFENDEKALWLSNMVTHYRHNHIASWDKCWGYNGHHYRGRWFGDYEEEKRNVNERAKRQIIRKAKAYMLKHEIGLSTFEKLQHNTEKTLLLANKILKGVDSRK